MFQKFILKAMLGKQLKDVPPEMQDKLIDAVMKDPKLFMDMAESIKGKMAAGKSQMDATMEVVREHQNTLQNILDPKKS